MSMPTPRGQFGPIDRIAAFARATEEYAESLDDHDLANVYWGKSLGLWQAAAILSADGADLRAMRRRHQSGRSHAKPSARRGCSATPLGPGTGSSL